MKRRKRTPLPKNDTPASPKKPAANMNEPRREGTLPDMAGMVDELVRIPNNMRIFRDRDKTFVGKRKDWERDCRRYNDEAEKLRSNIDVQQPRYKTELLKITDPGSDPVEEYLLSQKYANIASAQVACTFELGPKRPEHNKELALLGDYVVLTIIHDKVVEDEGGTELINEDECLWKKGESWVKEVWENINERWHISTFVAEIRRRLDRVKEDLLNLGGGAASGQRGETKRITKKEANVCARQLLMKTPSWDWTCRELAEQIPCCLGWISSLSAWKAYHEKRKELRRNKTIDTVSLSDELQAVLGQGDKDEVLNQLIAEQEGEEREDARRTKLYLSQQKKPERGGQ